MGISVNISDRVWRTLADSEFTNNSAALKQFDNNVILCRSGKKLPDDEDLTINNHPEFHQRWPFNSFF